MPVKKAKGDKAKCDELYSLIIRSEGQCLRCGARCECPQFPKKHIRGCPLTTSHIVGRRYSATRTAEDNSQCLCFSCHYYFENWPKEFSRWITKTIGVERYEELKRQAETVTKVDWTAERERLQHVWDDILTNA